WAFLFAKESEAYMAKSKYEKNVLPRLADVEKWLEGLDPKWIVIDPSAASFIAELRKRGYIVKKAKNDVLDGIRFVSTLLNKNKIEISDLCENTIREFSEYVWDEKAADRGEDKPIKQYDHAMEAFRYSCYTILYKNAHPILKTFKGGL
ncbi:MAG: terminase large subunit, partial [Clostridiales bacterium]|nr:terminase large subunit [Clostridiales bacterium]MDU1041719.1 terminase large subunit [Clostridiales bacterium]